MKTHTPDISDATGPAPGAATYRAAMATASFVDINFKVYRDRWDAIAGEPRLGAFLDRLFRFLKKTHVSRDGIKWVAWSRGRWGEVLQLSPQQVRLVLEKLRAAGLIVCEQHWYQGKKPLHVRLSNECLALVSTELTRPSTGGSIQPSTAGSMHPPLYKKLLKEPLEEEAKIAGGVAAAASETEKNVDEEKEKGKDRDANDAKLKPETATKLSALFATELHAHKVPHYTVTSQMRGQFALLRKALPDTNVEVITWACRNWGAFTRGARDLEGAFNVPGVPTVGFLLKFHNVAVALMAREAESAAYHAEVEAKAALQSIAAPFVQTIVLPKPKKLTIAEMNAMDEAFEAEQAAKKSVAS